MARHCLSSVIVRASFVAPHGSRALSVGRGRKGDGPPREAASSRWKGHQTSEPGQSIAETKTQPTKEANQTKQSNESWVLRPLRGRGRYAERSYGVAIGWYWTHLRRSEKRRHLPVPLADLTEIASVMRRSRPQEGRAPAGSGIIAIEELTNERTRPEQSGDEKRTNRSYGVAIGWNQAHLRRFG